MPIQPTRLDREPITYLQKMGKTWEQNSDNSFVFPRKTLGWEAIIWITSHCVSGEGDGKPFILTPEQSRFLLWWYALDENTGRFLYSEGVLQRLKGWGKDPFVCVISLFEAFGKCRFGGWDEDGNPIAVHARKPLVQIAATTEAQTETTMRLYSYYLGNKGVKALNAEIASLSVKRKGAGNSFEKVIVALTNSPGATEGKTPTFTIINETHHWVLAEHHEMHSVLDRNARKGESGTSRILAITNAYDPSLDSVAQKTREKYEADISRDGYSKIYYDSLEIATDAPIFFFKQGDNGESNGEINREYSESVIRQYIRIVEGDSKWHDLPSLSDSFFDTRFTPELNRRFYLNSIVASEDAWIDVRDFDACVKKTIEQKKVIANGDEIAMFFDGSKGDDSTVLVGCRISDGLIFKIASWHRPRKNQEGKGKVDWLTPRKQIDIERYNGLDIINPYYGIETVDAAVDRAFNTWKVVAFWADPSHAKEEVTNVQYWDSIISEWHIKYSSRLKTWAGSKTGAKSESIKWDMVEENNIKIFSEYTETVYELICSHDLLIDDATDTRQHFENARVYRTRFGGESIWKGKRKNRKIDLAVGSIGAYMLRMIYLKQHGVSVKKYNPLVGAAYRANISPNIAINSDNKNTNHIHPNGIGYYRGLGF